MDVETIDATYGQLQTESKQTETLIIALAGKLAAAAQAGNADAREWMLDLKEITIGVQNEENQTSNLLQALHGFIGQLDQTPQVQQPVYQQPAPQQPQYQQPQYQQPQFQQPAQRGGMMQRFMGGGFGRAIASGAGFGIGDDLIQQIF